MQSIDNMSRLFSNKATRRVLNLVEPLVSGNRRLYEKLNVQSMTYLKRHGTRFPSFVTANNITTARTSLILPTIALYSNGYTLLPATLVVLNVTFDYVDGAVARWERSQPATSNRTSAGIIQSARRTRLNATFGAYYDAIADKFFAIPLWLCMFQNSSEQPVLQLATLCLVTVEIYSSFIRTRAYFDEASPLAPNTAIVAAGDGGVQPKQSVVVASSVGKAKQALSMVGTAVCMLQVVEPLGTILLWASVPLAVGSVLQKSTEKTVYCEVKCRGGEPSLESLQLIELAKGQGSRLLVGIRGPSEGDCAGENEVIRIAKTLQLNHSVDGVILPNALPSQVDEAFLGLHDIHVVAVHADATFEETSARYDSALYQSGSIIPLNTEIADDTV